MEVDAKSWAILAALQDNARQSLTEQAELEAAPAGDFDTFVAAYQASILGLLSN